MYFFVYGLMGQKLVGVGLGGGVGPGMNTYSFCHTQFKIQILIEVEYLTEGLDFDFEA